MKKLLAIILCIAMIASISVTAFADDVPSTPPPGGDNPGGGDLKPTPTETKTVEKISLWPLVQQVNHFYGKGLNFNTVRTIVNLYNGFSTAYPRLAATDNGKAALKLLQDMYDKVKEPQFDETTGKIKPVEGLNLNYGIAQVWWTFGNTYVGQYVESPTKDSHGTEGTLTYAIAGAEAAIPTVTVPAAWTAPVLN